MNTRCEIQGLEPFRAGPEDTEWAERVLRAAGKVLTWSSIDVGIKMLTAKDTTEVGRPGSVGASAHTVIRPHHFDWDEERLRGLTAQGHTSWLVIGGCLYGSKIRITSTKVKVESCGGHWFSAEWATYGQVKWATDAHESHSSWGDSDLSEAEASLDRVRRLDKAWFEQRGQ